MDKEKIERTRINNRLPVAREGIPFIVISAGITIILFCFRLFYPAVIMSLISLFIISFFRDPEREKRAEENEVISPADGKIIDVWNLDNSDNPLGEPAIKISIFMSVFNVHVNRAPLSGKITDIIYNPGKFVSANLDKASEENENNRITLETEDNKKIVFTQIAGLIARRIVCWIKVNDYVKVGQRVGLIRFGSRLDVFIPAGSDTAVKSGQKVKAGVTT
ncbi:phosphatidylserine decarboxylase family protein, partial [Thermodesulfobacteriota bacterium]